MTKNTIARFVMAVAACVCFVQCAGTNNPNTSRTELDRASVATLEKLYETVPGARTLGKSAVAALVFPEVVKGGFMVGGQYGVGTLLKGGRAVGHYESVSGSYGLQAGVQKYGYVLFFMDQESLEYLDRSAGWEIGVGPSIVVVDEGIAKTISTTTMQKGVYAFIFEQKGLMAGLGLQGSKITRVNP